MNRYIVYIILFVAVFSSCDCVQKANGIVLDKETKLPLENVALGKFEKEDTSNSFSRRIYTDHKGHFDYQSVSGGIGKCPDLVLYFDRVGYKPTKITLQSFTENDTVYMEKHNFNRDSSIAITLAIFDNQIDDCILWLQTKALSEISDQQHIQIMLCLNTIFMREFKGGHYDGLKNLAQEKNYVRDIIKVYPEWIPNRGMGYYFPKLNMELYGTPSPYAIYKVGN